MNRGNPSEFNFRRQICRLAKRAKRNIFTSGLNLLRPICMSLQLENCQARLIMYFVWNLQTLLLAAKTSSFTLIPVQLFLFVEHLRMQIKEILQTVMSRFILPLTPAQLQRASLFHTNLLINLCQVSKCGVHFIRCARN